MRGKKNGGRRAGAGRKSVLSYLEKAPGDSYERAISLLTSACVPALERVIMELNNKNAIVGLKASEIILKKVFGDRIVMEEESNVLKIKFIDDEVKK